LKNVKKNWSDKLKQASRHDYEDTRQTLSWEVNPQPWAWKTWNLSVTL